MASSSVRVLAIDNHPTRFKTLQNILQNCGYTVTTCTQLEEATDKLLKRKGSFDIIMCDAETPGIENFEFVGHIVRAFSLPVIMVTDVEDKEATTKAFQQGVCAILRRPIQTNDLIDIWNFVVREQVQRARIDSPVENQLKINENNVAAANQSDDSVTTSSQSRKRKDGDEKEYVEASSEKKARLDWTPELHQKFLDAIDMLGDANISPKKILEAMNVKGVTRSQVSSHLQKHRQMMQKNQIAASAAPDESYNVTQSAAVVDEGYHAIHHAGVQQLPSASALVMENTSLRPPMLGFTQPQGTLYSEAPITGFNVHAQHGHVFRPPFKAEYQLGHHPLTSKFKPPFQAEHLSVPSSKPQFQDAYQQNQLLLPSEFGRQFQPEEQSSSFESGITSTSFISDGCPLLDDLFAFPYVL